MVGDGHPAGRTPGGAPLRPLPLPSLPTKTGAEGAAPAGAGTVPSVSIPDIRDYHLVNSELVQRLDEGHPRVRLVGAEGQRLLVSRLKGTWQAVVEVEGRAGPELAAELDSPGLTVVCLGPAADGAARGLRAGLVVIVGDAGAAVGYAMTGGAVVVTGRVAPRAGLNQAGGDLILLGEVGALAGERQSGGCVFALGSAPGPHSGRGRRGGRFLSPKADGDRFAGPDPDDAQRLRARLEEAAPWIGGS